MAGVVLFLILLILFVTAGAFAVAFWEGYQFNRLSAAGHLAKAREVCGPTSHCADTQEAIKHLHAVPSTAAEFPEVSKLLSQLNQQIADRAREQMTQNFNGDAHDPFQCGQSAANNEDIVSFDYGQTWWKDDGRCANRLQKKRDEDAGLSSYWPTTLRVETDMNSSWLPDEERTCWTYPDGKGKVATVRCSTTGEADHDIPVTFWGGVNRNIFSNWKCRREKSLLDDHFVCRAID